MRPLPLVVAVGLAWGVLAGDVLAWDVLAWDGRAGGGLLDALRSVPETPGALGAMLVAWLSVVVATMGAGALPAAHHVATSTLRPARTVTAFVLAHTAVWTALGGIGVVVVAGGVAVLPGVLTALTPPVAVATVPVAALLLAAGWQLCGPRRAAVDDCRRGVFVPARGARADRAAVALGGEHALAGVVAYWALLLVVLTAPGGPLPWLIALAALVRAEQARGLARRLARPTATVLAVLAVLALTVLAGTLWFPDPAGVVLPDIPPHHG